MKSYLEISVLNSNIGISLYCGFKVRLTHIHFHVAGDVSKIFCLLIDIHVLLFTN